jgi:hypothetical protein
MCKEKNGPQFYIGYRHANYVPSSDDFGTHYFTSNDYVKNNFDKFNHYIIAEFYNKQDAYKFENQLIKELGTEYCINFQKYKKHKDYTKQKVDVSPKPCALPGCDKIHTNWRIKCCSLIHNRIYAGQQRHKNITSENTPTK